MTTFQIAYRALSSSPVLVSAEEVGAVLARPPPHPGLAQLLLQSVRSVVLTVQEVVEVVPPVSDLLAFAVAAASAPAVALQSETGVFPVMVGSAPVVASVMAAVLPVVALHVVAGQREMGPEAAEHSESERAPVPAELPVFEFEPEHDRQREPELALMLVDQWWQAPLPVVSAVVPVRKVRQCFVATAVAQIAD